MTSSEGGWWWSSRYRCRLAADVCPTWPLSQRTVRCPPSALTGDVAEHFTAQHEQRDHDAAGLIEDPHVHPRAHPILGPYPASDPALAQDGVLLPVSPGDCSEFCVGAPVS